MWRCEINYTTIEKLVSDIPNELKDLISKKYGQISIRGKITEINTIESYGYYYGKIEDFKTSDYIKFKVPTSLLSKLQLQKIYHLTGILTVQENKKFGSLNPLLRINSIDEVDDKVEFEEKRNLHQISDEIFSRPKINVDYYLNNKSKVELTVITGKNSKAKEDFESQLRGTHNYYFVRYKLINIESAYEVAKAIEDSQKDSDLIAITRGGGESIKYLGDDIIVKAIRLSNLPIISAVGHVLDYIRLDEEVDKSLGTPSALGTYLREHAERINKRRSYQNNVSQYSHRSPIYKKGYYSNYYRRGGCLSFFLLTFTIMVIILSVL
jgi:exodeoxyribonuclease VII large subunit